jgi:hypothetical protein
MEGMAFCKKSRFQANTSQGPLNPVVKFTIGKTEVARSKSNFIINRLRKKLLFRHLKNKANPSAKLKQFCLTAAYRVSIKVNLPGSRFQQTVKVLDKSRFTGTTRPK